jgi:hypothetical protein
LIRGSRAAGPARNARRRGSVDLLEACVGRSGEAHGESIGYEQTQSEIAEFSFCDMACSSSLAALGSFACWRGRSTAGPSHQGIPKAVERQVTKLVVALCGRS